MSLQCVRTKSGWRALAVALCGLLVLVQAGCSALARIPTPEPVTIAFSCEERDREVYEQIAHDFHQQFSHLTVEVIPRGGRQGRPLEIERVDALRGSEEALQGLYSQGELFDIQPYIETDLSLDLEDLQPSAIALFSYGGETWALPAGLDVNVLYYNQDLFDRYNVPYPWIGWTWEDFLYAALAVRDPEASVYGYMPTTPTVDPNYWDALLFALEQGAQLFDHPTQPTRILFNNPSVVDAVDWYARLYREHDVAPTPQEAQQTFRSGAPRQYAYYMGIMEGHAGMWMMPFSERGGGYWPDPWEMRWGMVLLPKAGAWATLPDGEGYAISSHTTHAEASWKWIAYLSAEMPHRLIPARRSQLESIEYTEAVGSEAAAVAQAALENVSTSRPAPWVVEELGSKLALFGQAVDKVISEDWLSREAMDWAQEQADMQQ